jgi:hypothetical protein
MRDLELQMVEDITPDRLFDSKLISLKNGRTKMEEGRFPERLFPSRVMEQMYVPSMQQVMPKNEQ